MPENSKLRQKWQIKQKQGVTKSKFAQKKQESSEQSDERDEIVKVTAEHKTTDKKESHIGTHSKNTDELK